MKLWKHQETAVQKYAGRKFFGLLFDCGLGKTLTGIRIAEAKDKPVLIICPNVLCKQWEEDIKENKEKEWETVVCTSARKGTKKFKASLEHLCETL